MIVLIATENPLKIEALNKVMNLFHTSVEILPVSIPSGVENMPFDKEILAGARNRISGLKEYAKRNRLKVDYYATIEAGIFSYFEEAMLTNLAIINDGILESIGTSASFPIPKAYLEEVKEKTLGKVIDEKFSKENTSKTTGALKILTNGHMDRFQESYEAYLMAITKHINKNW